MTLTLAVGPVSEFLADSPALLRKEASAAVVALGLVLAFRLYRRAVVVTPGRVVLRELFFSRVLAASEIERFDPPGPRGVLRQTGLRLTLRDGRTRCAHAFAASQLDGPGLGVAESAELNRWLEAQRHGRQVADLPPAGALHGPLAVAWRAWLTVLVLLLVLTLTAPLAV
jgi:hypothetical protein